MRRQTVVEECRDLHLEVKKFRVTISYVPFRETNRKHAEWDVFAFGAENALYAALVIWHRYEDSEGSTFRGSRVVELPE
jgi:hypothetical protein